MRAESIPAGLRLEIVDTFRLDNRPLQERFARHTSVFADSQVKALFCTVPANSLEDTLIFGFGHNLSRKDVFPPAYGLRAYVSFG